MLFYCSMMIGFSAIMLIPCKHRFKLGENNYQLSTAVISFLLIGLLIGLRDGIGLDDVTYLRTFNEANSLGYATRDIEISFMKICDFVIKIGGNYHCVILFYSLLGCYLIGSAMKKMVVKNEQILVFMVFWSFFFADLFTAIRQLLAIGLLLNAYVCYKKENNLKAIIWLIIATFIHKTALAGVIYLLLVPIVKRLSLTKKIIILLFCFILQYIPFVSLILNVISSINFLNQFYYVRFFLTSGASNLFSDPLGFIATIMLIMSIVIMVWYEKSNIESKEINKIVDYKELEAFNFLYWSSLMVLNQFGYVRRITYYIGFFMAMYLVKSIGMFSRGSKKSAKILFYLFFLAVFCYSVLNYKVRGSVDPALIPYKANFVLFD